MTRDDAPSPVTAAGGADEIRDRAALTSRARREVLDALRASPVPLDAAAVADTLGLHVTTARFHLDHLVDAGLAGRATGNEKRRGRPRILYSPIAYSPAIDHRGSDSRGFDSPEHEARDQLLDLLIAGLADTSDGPARAIRAGRRWVDGFTAVVDHSADAGARLLGVLDRLGFDPLVDEHDIRLRACPFRASARAHPEVVCSVHQGLVEQLSDTTVTLLPFVEPELCLIRLDSADDPQPTDTRPIDTRPPDTRAPAAP
ncbi:helix-turn-helix transcriptional regulator [Millisia brevis]|uniref:helix-turn-helix transcriptional regulator n=1 Tax=Millisia brevis TaxID=264148 RepID=UPI00082990AB|nr:helix-turn-helix domain-containing protein [Millisia brevis]